MKKIPGLRILGFLPSNELHLQSQTRQMLCDSVCSIKRLGMKQFPTTKMFSRKGSVLTFGKAPTQIADGGCYVSATNYFLMFLHFLLCKGGNLSFFLLLASAPGS